MLLVIYFLRLIVIIFFSVLPREGVPKTFKINSKSVRDYYEHIRKAISIDQSFSAHYVEYRLNNVEYGAIYTVGLKRTVNCSETCVCVYVFHIRFDGKIFVVKE